MRATPPPRLVREEVLTEFDAMWRTGEFQHLFNPDMPWNDEIRAAWARHNRLAASPGTVALMLPLVAELNVRAILPTVRVPTLVLQHADDPLMTPAMGKDVADHITGAKYVELPGHNIFHFVDRGVSRFRRSPSSSLVTKQMWPMIGYWPRCCLPTLWTRRAAPPTWVIVTGMHCSMRTTPSCGRNSTVSEVVR